MPRLHSTSFNFSDSPFAPFANLRVSLPCKGKDSADHRCPRRSLSLAFPPVRMYRKAVGCLDQRGTQFKTVSLRRTVCQSLKATHVIQCIFSGKLKNKFKWAKLTKASNVFRFFHRAFDLKTSTCSKHLSRAKVQRRKRQEQKLIHSLTSRITGYRVCEKEACLRQSDLFWAIHFTPFENV